MKNLSVLVVTQNSGNVSINSVITEDQVRKRELRLLKNRLVNLNWLVIETLYSFILSI